MTIDVTLRDPFPRKFTELAPEVFRKSKNALTIDVT